MEPTYLNDYDDDLSVDKSDNATDLHLKVPLPWAALSEMADDIHAQAVKSGWWKPTVPTRNVGEVLMLICSEASEALEAYRAGMPMNQMLYEYRNSEVRPTPQDEEGNYGKPVGLPSEMADIIIRVLDACGAWGIDIASAVAEKVEYNKTRPYRHGDKRA